MNFAIIIIIIIIIIYIIFVYFIKYRSDFNLINENIESVLGISLVKKPSENELNSIDITCGICYSYQNPYEVSSSENNLKNLAPDVTCFNKKCSKQFHQACLHDWLQSLTTSKTSFGTIYGNCPYCFESIAVFCGPSF